MSAPPIRTVERYLALSVLKDKLVDKIINERIVEDDEEVGEGMWLLFDTQEGKKIKSYKRKIDNLPLPPKELWETFVATQLLLDGYHLIPIEGGWLVQGGEEVYQLANEECTCKQFITRLHKSDRCKHLVFRDFHLHYRARINQLRKEFTTSD